VNRTEPTGVDKDYATLLSEQVAAIARLLLSPGTVTESLSRIVALAVEAIDSCDEAGLCGAAATGTLAYGTSPVLTRLSALQAELGEGPCVDALSGADTVYTEDLASGETRWPTFAPAAAAAGLRSALAYRLFLGEQTLGALQLFTRRPGGFRPIERAQGLLFAVHAGVALAIAHEHDEGQDRSQNFATALASREMIGQAQGILMERERVTGAQAFELLRKASQHSNIRLRDVAQRLVDTGNLADGAELS
jgi:hypothetical protein